MRPCCECCLHSSLPKNKLINSSGLCGPYWKRKNRMGEAKILSSRLAYKGGHIQVREDRVIEPSGHEGVREFGVHPGAVFSVPPQEMKIVFLSGNTGPPRAEKCSKSRRGRFTMAKILESARFAS